MGRDTYIIHGFYYSIWRHYVKMTVYKMRSMKILHAILIISLQWYTNLLTTVDCWQNRIQWQWLFSLQVTRFRSLHTRCAGGHIKQRHCLCMWINRFANKNIWAAKYICSFMYYVLVQSLQPIPSGQLQYWVVTPISPRALGHSQVILLVFF